MSNRMKKQRKFPNDRIILDGLQDLQAVPERDHATAVKARNRFLNQVEQYQAVSKNGSQRHTGWIANLFTRKENYRMSTLGTILLMISLILGGSGITAVSAQNSLPDTTLYPVRLLTEQIQFGLTVDPEAKWQLALTLTEQRMAEIRTMLISGTAPSEAVMTRLNTQLETTLRLAAQLSPDQVTGAMAQTWVRLETQDRLMTQTQSATPAGEAIIARVQEMVETRMRQIEADQVDPALLQQQIQLQQQLQQQIQQQLQQQLQQQIQLQTCTPLGTQYQYQQMGPQATITRTPAPCPGNGPCGNH